MFGLQDTSKKFWSRIFFILIPGFLLLFITSLSIGSIYIPLDQTFGILLGFAPEQATWENIVLGFRLPKAITACLVGAGLGVSGLMMQTLFRNPLAGPFVLGITSGASLGVALIVLASFALGTSMGILGAFGSWIIVLAAGAGAFGVLLLVLLISLHIRDSMSLLIIGLMFGSATGALVSVLQFFSKAEQIQAYLIWTFGSLGGLSQQEFSVFIPIIVLGLIISIALSKPLNALLLGENYALSMGMNLAGTRFWIIISTSLLAGTITAFCGPIAFIGLAVPHLVRIFLGTSDHKTLIPAIICVGAAIMLICDLIAQLPGSEYTLPINAVTSIFGAPLVIWLIVKKRNISSSFAR